MEPVPSKPRVITTLRQRFEAEGDFSDDMGSSSSSSSEDGAPHESKVVARKRLYVLRPRSFNFSGCMAHSQPIHQPTPVVKQQ